MANKRRICLSKKYFFTMIILLILSLFSGILLLEFSTPTETNISNSPNESNNEITNAADITISIYIDDIYGATSGSAGSVHGTVRTESEDGTSRSYSSFTQRLSRSNNTLSIAVTRTSYWWRSFEITSYSSVVATPAADVNEENSVVVGTNGGGGSYVVTGLNGLYLRYNSGYYTRNGTFTMDFYLEIVCPLDHQGGSSSTSRVTYNTYNQKATSVSKPTRTGYTFKGYYTGANGGGSQVIDENLNWRWDRSVCYATTLYARWEPKTYRVDTNILSPSDVQDYNSGTMAQSYDGQTKTGLTDQAFSDIKADTTLTISNIVPAAGMHVSSITVNKGTVSTTTSNGLITGCTYTLNPGILGDPAGSSSWDVIISINMDWNEYKIDINFYKLDGTTQQGGTFDLYKKLPGGSETLVASEISNEVTGQELLQYEGQFILKNFKAIEKGAYVNLNMNNVSLSTPTGAGTIEIVDNTIVYTANQTGEPSGGWDNAILIYTSTNQLIATLKYLNGTSDETASAEYVSSGTKLGLPELSRTGYEFKGWSLTPNNTGVYYDADTNWNNVSVSVDNKDVCISDVNVGDIYFNLYAIWEANEYKINYNLAGGSHGSSHPTTATYRDKYDENSGENDNIINISNPTKKGYTFTGWTISGDDYDSDTAMYGLDTNNVTTGWTDKATKVTAEYFKNLSSTKNGTITLTANWTANTYTIAFNGNDNTGGSTSSKKATYDSYVTLTANGFIRAGYVFTGWNTKSDGTGTPYSDKATVKNLTIKDGDTVTLFAQWQSTIASGITEVYEDAGTYYINTADDLAKLIYTTESKAVGNGFTFIQTANIDLSNLTYLPIGRLNSFSATYDGQGYTISGLSSYNGTDANDNYLETNGGLFANAGGAKIKNVIIENATIYGQNAGIIAGIGNEGTKISNCVVSGTVNGTNAGSIIGNGNGASITACLAKGVNTASFAGGSANVDSCIYELTDGTRGVSDSFNDYSAWVYPSNFAYPMPKAFIWYPYPELSEDSLNTWLGK